ncbi:MAG: HDOD domain-containing protein [Myxococcales bacterium]|nr:HDOD domain-containing protein [Myxococcales bacterium]
MTNAADLARDLPTTRLDRPEIELLAASLDALPALPSAVTRLMGLLAAGDPSPKEVEAVVRLDAALTSKLLSIANSARFGVRREVRSVSHATALLGARRMFDALVCASVANAMPKRLVGYGMDAHGAWLHNVATAVLAEELARQLAPDLASDAFTGGLLHDVGKLAIASLVERRWPELAVCLHDRGLTFVEAERDVLGIGHPEVGELVLRGWNLPACFCEVARFHHDPEAAPVSGLSLVAVIHVASGLAHTFGFGADAGGLCRSTSDAARARLGLDRALVERTVSGAVPRILELAQTVT